MYKLQSLATGAIIEDTGWTLDAPGETTPGLIRAIYKQKQLKLKGVEHGIYTFADWLPIHRTLDGSSAPATYKKRRSC